MRTTISLFDRLARQVRRSEPPPFKLLTVRGVRARRGVDLDRPRALDAQEDEARFELGCGHSWRKTVVRDPGTGGEESPPS